LDLVFVKVFHEVFDRDFIFVIRQRFHNLQTRFELLQLNSRKRTVAETYHHENTVDLVYLRVLALLGYI